MEAGGEGAVVLVPASCEWRQGREKKSRPVSRPVEVGTCGQGGVVLNRERSLEETAWLREQWSKSLEWPIPN